MAACATSGASGPCDASHAADAATGLAFLGRLEADPNVHITVNVDGGSVVGVNRFGSGVIQIGRGWRGLAENQYTLSGVVAHEVYEEGLFQLAGTTRYLSPGLIYSAHPDAVRYGEDPSYAGVGLATRTSRSCNGDVGRAPAPFGGKPIC